MPNRFQKAHIIEVLLMLCRSHTRVFGELVVSRLFTEFSLNSDLARELGLNLQTSS